MSNNHMLSFQESKEHKTNTFLFVADTYRFCGLMFQKAQMAECFKIDRDYDSWSPHVREPFLRFSNLNVLTDLDNSYLD